ncbi:MAG: hypothetical protein K2J11_08540, partial [Oscillospiraceae bacterium]|nr:hypothetical protein [Oscillospiraceae bacterium]
MKTVHRTVFKGHLVALHYKEGRSCSPLLEMTVVISHLLLRFGGMRLRARGGDFALCGARPKGSALWTSA